MSDYTTFFTTTFHPAIFLEEFGDGVKGAADLEGADALQVFAFEIQSDGGLCRCAAGEACAGQVGLRRGGEAGERLGGDDGGEVDVRGDELVGGDDGGAGEGGGGGKVGHFWNSIEICTNYKK